MWSKLLDIFTSIYIQQLSQTFYFKDILKVMKLYTFVCIYIYVYVFTHKRGKTSRSQPLTLKKKLRPTKGFFNLEGEIYVYISIGLTCA